MIESRAGNEMLKCKHEWRVKKVSKSTLEIDLKWNIKLLTCPMSLPPPHPLPATSF